MIPKDDKDTLSIIADIDRHLSSIRDEAIYEGIRKKTQQGKDIEKSFEDKIKKERHEQFMKDRESERILKEKLSFAVLKFVKLWCIAVLFITVGSYWLKIDTIPLSILIGSTTINIVACLVTVIIGIFKIKK